MSKWWLIFGVIGCLYSQPTFEAKPSFTVPNFITFNLIDNQIVNHVLWAHIKVSGWVNVEGWVPIGEM